jgi:hypothetical protein
MMRWMHPENPTSVNFSPVPGVKRCREIALQ